MTDKNVRPTELGLGAPGKTDTPFAITWRDHY
jgi:hypothetical protein